jgi:hypothetical protein
MSRTGLARSPPVDTDACCFPATDERLRDDSTLAASVKMARSWPASNRVTIRPAIEHVELYSVAAKLRAQFVVEV